MIYTSYFSQMTPIIHIFIKLKSKDNLYISGKFSNTSENVFINILKVDKLIDIKKY